MREPSAVFQPRHQRRIWQGDARHHPRRRHPQGLADSRDRHLEHRDGPLRKHHPALVPCNAQAPFPPDIDRPGRPPRERLRNDPPLPPLRQKNKVAHQKRPECRLHAPHEPRRRSRHHVYSRLRKDDGQLELHLACRYAHRLHRQGRTFDNRHVTSLLRQALRQKPGLQAARRKVPDVLH